MEEFFGSPNKSVRIAAVFLMLTMYVAGCTYTVAVTDNIAAYSMPLIQGAPKVILSDLSDHRSDKKTIGQIGGLTLAEPSTQMNVILTNRIATRLRDEGVNLQKTNLAKPGDTAELAQLMASSSANWHLASYRTGLPRIGRFGRISGGVSAEPIPTIPEEEIVFSPAQGSEALVPPIPSGIQSSWS